MARRGPEVLTLRRETLASRLLYPAPKGAGFFIRTSKTTGWYAATSHVKSSQFRKYVYSECVPLIIFVCGRPATGKTASSIQLYRKLHAAAYIEGDSLTNIQKFKTDADVIELKLKNAACLIKNFVDAGCNYVICDGVVASPNELKALIESQSYSYVLFELVADSAIREKRWQSNVSESDGSRPLSDVDVKFQVTFEPLSSPTACRIDTTDLEPEQVAITMADVIR
jgi:hypothetical protein